MTNGIRITCLVDDQPGPSPLRAEHGLSFLVQTGDANVLFDTGQTGLAVANARALGLNLASVDRIVLSHGHYDHTGGLEAVLATCPTGRLYAHPAAFDRKYSFKQGLCHDISMPASASKALRASTWELVKTTSVAEIATGLYATGPIPRLTEFEDVGGPFFLDENAREPDPILDDQALYFLAAEGVVVLLGCAHAGVVNTLQHIQKITGGRNIHAVIGGMHLLNASRLRLQSTEAALAQLDVRVLAPCHCTGSAAMTFLQNRFPQAWRNCLAGSTFSFPGLESQQASHRARIAHFLSRVRAHSAHASEPSP